MRTLALVALFTVLHLTASVLILQSSTTSTTIVAQPKIMPILSALFNGQFSPYPSSAGPGVQWITGPSTTTVALTFESLFYSSCVGAANLKIFASVSFQAYLD